MIPEQVRHAYSYIKTAKINNQLINS